MMFEKIKLSANILFSGIGCQEQGIKDTNLFDLDIKATSDINKDSIISYAILHCGLTKEIVDTYTYPSLNEMSQELFDKNIGYDCKTNKVCDWFNKDEYTIKKLGLLCSYQIIWETFLKLKNYLMPIYGLFHFRVQVFLLQVK